MAPVLFIEFVSGSLERLDCLAAGNYRQFHPPATSMTSSRMLAGNGSPCFRRLFKYPSIASRMFAVVRVIRVEGCQLRCAVAIWRNCLDGGSRSLVAL